MSLSLRSKKAEGVRIASKKYAQNVGKAPSLDGFELAQCSRRTVCVVSGRCNGQTDLVVDGEERGDCEKLTHRVGRQLGPGERLHGADRIADRDDDRA